MRAGVVVTGVLGLGTILVFAAAALTAAMFPNGTIVGGMNGMMFEKGFERGPMVLPAPAPVGIQVEPGAGVDGSGGVVVTDGFQPLPGDVVDDTPTVERELDPAP